MHLSARTGRVAAWTALPLAVLLSGAVVATSSYAAFSDTTDTPGNSWSTGHVDLTDDDQGQALFTAADLVPGASGQACLTVSADTPAASTVALYTASSSGSTELADALQMTVEQGAAVDDCDALVPEGAAVSDSLSGLQAATSFGDGIAPWSVAAGGGERTYRIGWELPHSADNTVQDASATTSFVWELQTD